MNFDLERCRQPLKKREIGISVSEVEMVFRIRELDQKEKNKYFGIKEEQRIQAAAKEKKIIKVVDDPERLMILNKLRKLLTLYPSDISF